VHPPVPADPPAEPMVQPDERGLSRSLPREGLLAACVGTLAACAFAPAIADAWIYDDHPLIAQNLYVRSFAFWKRWFTRDFWDINEELKRFGGGMVYWRPGVSASYALDWMIGRGSPVLFHLTNTFWHAVVGVLAYFTLSRWIGAAIPAFIAALLFALHPTKAESVAWIAGRTDILCMVPMLLASLGVAWRLRGKKQGLPLEIAATLVAYTMKEQAIVLPAFVAVETWVFLGRPEINWRTLRRMIGSCAGQLAVALTYLAIRARVLPVQPVKTEPMPIAQHVQEVLETMGRYAALTFAPMGLSIQQGLMRQENGKLLFEPAYAVLGVIALLAMAACVVMSRKRMPGVAIGVGFYLVAVLPTSNVVTTDMITMLSERFLYVPVLGIALAIGTVLQVVAVSDARPSWRRAWLGACLGAAVMLGVLAARRSYDYADEDRFWSRERQLHPESLPAFWYTIGKEAEAKHFERALGLAVTGQQIAAHYYHRLGYEHDFIAQGVELMLCLLPDHATKSLSTIDDFFRSELDPNARSAHLALGPMQVNLVWLPEKWASGRMKILSPRMVQMRAAIASRVGNDERAAKMALEAYDACPGCIDIGKISALILGRAGRYDDAERVLASVVAWTSESVVADTRDLIRKARAARALADSAEGAEKLQQRATELATLEAWGRAYDVLAPAKEAIKQAPDFAMGFAELAWRAGEFAVAREVLSALGLQDRAESITRGWSTKMGWTKKEGS